MVPTADSTAGWLDEVAWAGSGRLKRYTPADLAAVPSFEAVKPAVVPAPPKVPADEAEVERALRLAYGTAHERVLGSRPFARGLARRADPLKWLPAAAALREEGLTPLAWAVFVMREVWRGKMGRSGAPTPSFVWDAAKVEKWRRWCWESVGTLHTGRTIWTPALRELAAKIAALREQLGHGESTDAVVARVFPVAEQRKLMARAAAEAERARADLEKAVASGEWLWGGL